jgi:hypothetical protein
MKPILTFQIPPEEWERLFGETVSQPVQILRLPPALTEQEKEYLRIGKSISQMQALAPNDSVLIEFNNKDGVISISVNGGVFQLWDVDAEDGNIADILERMVEEISVV